MREQQDTVHIALVAVVHGQESEVPNEADAAVVAAASLVGPVDLLQDLVGRLRRAASDSHPDDAAVVESRRAAGDAVAQGKKLFGHTLAAAGSSLAVVAALGEVAGNPSERARSLANS